MTNPDAQSKPSQAAIDAKAETQTSQYAGGSAMLDAEAALTEQDIIEPIDSNPAATNASPDRKSNPNAASQNAASGYPIDTEQGDGNISLRDDQQGK
ncbi:hypothetical protein H6F67_05305 [Microcoleus sp. FACHB-1515]|uniref:hypothetical protein n=1 Tax=Cyanophyceae TaxID=3028117 RepID=UPI001682BBFD|nr:hypothetical protein [Microcoleus sp. FACHB-1515]MBD2089267.1 hypothetical protein [Microcoleus sp. FACHB-1515]